MSSQLRLSIYAAVATMATSLSLLSVFSSTHWMVPVMGGVVIVGGSCALVRRSPLPSAFEPVVAAAAVLLWVTLLFAHHEAQLGLIPTGAAFHQLAQIGRNGFTEIRDKPTPAPPHDGLVMITVVGVAAIALIVDLMTVTLRRAALSGLPLLALFTVCAATGHHGVGLIAFIAAAIGFLWLLYADNREKVARWGAAVGTGAQARPASTWSTDPAAAPAPASLGRQVGAVAISVGVLLPLFVPGLHTGINKHGGVAGVGAGGGSVQTFDPLVRVGADLANRVAVPVLSYRTTATDPAYLRLTSLDVFDGTSFTESSLSAPSNATVSESLPVDPPLGTPVQTSVTVSPRFEAHWLPVPATTVGINVDHQWRYDATTETIFSATTDSHGLAYTARSIPNQPTAAELAQTTRPAENLGADLALPSIDPAVVRLTHRITRHATSRYQAALAIQRFFTDGNGFVYDTSVAPDSSGDALARFLLQTRRGFCQQYAAAMTVMARLSGIPARVAVGFTRGKQQGNVWTVTTHDAHAWPELWFQGYGWLSFEPTPRGDGQAVAPPYTRTGSGNGNSGQNGNSGSDTQPAGRGGKRTKAGANGALGRANDSVPTSLGHRHHSAARNVVGVLAWILVGIVAALLTVPGAVRLAVRRRRWRRLADPDHAADAAWVEVRDTAVDYGLPWPDDRSPRQIAAAVLAALSPDSAGSDAMLRLARSEERSRYAPSHDVAFDLKADVATIRSAAARHAPRRTRLTARVLPLSTLRQAQRVWARSFATVERLLRTVSPVRRLLRLVTPWERRRGELATPR